MHFTIKHFKLFYLSSFLLWKPAVLTGTAPLGGSFTVLGLTWE